MRGMACGDVWSLSVRFRLTDETIRKNFELYGHPDGRQEVSMGIALPKWIVESSNNIWVLGVYGLIFGVALPAMVVSMIRFWQIHSVLTVICAGSVVVRQQAKNQGRCQRS